MLTWREMRSAPAAVAARTNSLTPTAIAVASPLAELPNGPTSTSRPAARIASMAASTCGPGSPSTKGSMVNSAFSRTVWRLARC